MIVAYIILSILLAGGVFWSRKDSVMETLCWCFYGIQAIFAVYTVTLGMDSVSVELFTFDRTGTLFFVLLALISPVVFYHSRWYLDTESPREKAQYNALLMLLCLSIGCVYFSNNIAVTWIFLEATTLCTAGIIYHRRNARSLEATWKYIFVCSVGIAMAYLGILLLGGIAAGGGLGYDNLTREVVGANPLFLKIAFLFILVGYSCKLEIFPLYNIGIDANYSTPAPASALISTALVNAGFVAVYRVYVVMENSDVFGWVSNVLIIAGLFSVLIGSVFLRRTSHYKRLLSYSTVENMGLAVIGLGVGGAGVFAAIIHVTGHTLLKSTMFLQIAQVGKTFGHYQIKRTGGYIGLDRSGAIVMMVLAIMLLAFPPSPLFVSEVLMFRQIILNGQWWLLILVVFMLCTVMYNLGRHIIRLCYQPITREIIPQKAAPGLMVTIYVLLAAAIILGVWRPEWVITWFNAMAIQV